LHSRGDFCYQFVMQGSHRLSGEAGMDRADQPVATKEEGGREGIEIYGLRKFRCKLVGFACKENRVTNAVAANEFAEAGGISELLSFFKREFDDF
jgi:hypothetical protein